MNFTYLLPRPKKQETHRSGKLEKSLSIHGQLATSREGGDLDTTTLLPDDLLSDDTIASQVASS